MDNMSASDYDEISPIELNIRVPMTITGDDNRVSSDPSASANKIAIGIMHALKTVSMNGSGLPMIDDSGRPRPIKIDIAAGVNVDGSRNVVGDAAAVLPTNLVSVTPQDQQNTITVQRLVNDITQGKKDFKKLEQFETAEQETCQKRMSPENFNREQSDSKKKRLS
ncbi:hypothetical protein GcM3_188007 [Golovinomyces cichoracearum]|uniref:Uncharacterized protein n=1 Tax=Golovinomyces cichoracearum TaxID=62708 RepID=A0A420HJ08_9PEZI|nr:hypothetical protein GcM3_188007 [Golovinomyces cichoracearum]